MKVCIHFNLVKQLLGMYPEDTATAMHMEMQKNKTKQNPTQGFKPLRPGPNVISTP